MTLRDILTPFQFRLCPWVSRGWTNPEIAAKVRKSKNTIKKQLSAAYENLGYDIKGHGERTPRVELAVRYALEQERGLY